MQAESKLKLLLCFIFLVSAAAVHAPAQGSVEQGQVESWDSIRYRRWVGPNLWANRLADWEVFQGYLRPTSGNPDLPVRTVHAITRTVPRDPGAYALSVRVSAETGRSAACRVGFLIGAGAGLLDYRAAALVHCNSGKGGGLLALLELGKNPRLSFRDNNAERTAREYPELAGISIGMPNLLESNRSLSSPWRSARPPETASIT